MCSNPSQRVWLRGNLTNVSDCLTLSTVAGCGGSLTANQTRRSVQSGSRIRSGVDVDRRSLLSSIGLGSVVGIGSRAGPALVKDSKESSRSLVLTSPFLRSSCPPSSCPEVGSSSLLSGPLHDETGVPVGTFRATRVVLESGHNVDLKCLEQHVFEVEDGMLVGSGISTRQPSVVDTFCVGGGTGVFENSGGSYRLLQDDSRAGGDGSIQFTFQLTRG